MGEAASIGLGVVVGVACALPLALLQRRAVGGEARMDAGIASVMGSFLVLQGAMVAVWLAAPDAAPSFGVVAVLSFLAAVIAAVIVWHVPS